MDWHTEREAEWPELLSLYRNSILIYYVQIRPPLDRRSLFEIFNPAGAAYILGVIPDVMKPGRVWPTWVEISRSFQEFPAIYLILHANFRGYFQGDDGRRDACRFIKWWWKNKPHVSHRKRKTTLVRSRFKFKLFWLAKEMSDKWVTEQEQVSLPNLLSAVQSGINVTQR